MLHKIGKLEISKKRNNQRHQRHKLTYAVSNRLGQDTKTKNALLSRSTRIKRGIGVIASQIMFVAFLQDRLILI